MSRPAAAAVTGVPGLLLAQFLPPLLLSIIATTVIVLTVLVWSLYRFASGLRAIRAIKAEWRHLRTAAPGLGSWYRERRAGRDRRTGGDRRRADYDHVPERRSGADRRKRERRQRQPVLAVLRS